MSDIEAQQETRSEEPTPEPTAAKWWLVGMAVASAAGAALYRGLMWDGYGHSAAMFLGLPAVLAILLALTPNGKSLTGGIVKGITFALLIIAPLLGEGYLCILFAAPLFYIVGIVIGLVTDSVRKRRANRRGTTLTCVAVVLLPMCLEGVVPQLTFDRTEMVEVTQSVHATASQVEHALGQSPRLEAPLPAYLRIGFPRPLAASGGGLNVGDLRQIHFSGAEGDPPGDLTMRVAERKPGYVRFDTTGDGSKLKQWIRWDSSAVEWRPIDATHTAVTWRIEFQRELDPAWYFIPWERAAVREAAQYLIEANATPADAAP